MRFTFSFKLLLAAAGIILLSAAARLLFTNTVPFDIATPYNAVESINWLVKSLTGPAQNNPSGVEYIPKSYILNENVASEYKLTFVGDIMPQDGCKVTFSDGIKDFISGSDYLFGNFEGTISEEIRALPFVSSDLRHTKMIIETLAGFFPPDKTCLSVGNNHAGDLDSDKFLRSVEMLETRGFKVFGWKDRPFVDILDNIRVVSGTMWSNRKRDHVFMLEDAEAYIKPEAFNFLYAHFGYELELYPREDMIRTGKGLIKNFDALIGHHSHCPQPVTFEEVKGVKRLLAYSLGDFSGALTTKKYQYGIAVKISLGKNSEGRWLAGKVEWCMTRCSRTDDGYVVRVSDDNIWGNNGRAVRRKL